MKTLHKFFLNDNFILFLIALNSAFIFAEGFTGMSTSFFNIIHVIDSLFTFVFFIEIVIKIRYYGWIEFTESAWNKIDLVVVALSLPSIFYFLVDHLFENLSFLLIFRIARVFKFFRFFKFIPDMDQIARGVQRALKDSVLVLLAFFVYNFVISVLSCYLFKEISPDFYGDPVKAFYSTFRIFTVEGWYEIPDQIARNSSVTIAFFSKIYFILLLITGGIFGLSLVNSIFVDAMISDNTDDLEHKIDNLSRQVEKLLSKYEKTDDTAIKNLTNTKD